MVTTISFGPVVMDVGRRENKIRYTRSCETKEGKLVEASNPQDSMSACGYTGRRVKQAG
jgi:hypothetical protein